LKSLEGGTLNQHVEHHRNGAKHEIIIEKDSKLFELIGQEAIISHCNHHQIVGELGDNLKVNCRDNQGMIHGVESCEKESWIVTVQWHPERCDDELNARIFKNFIEKCKQYKKKKVVIFTKLSLINFVL